MASSKKVIVVASDAVTPIDPDQTLKASKALLAHIQKAAKEGAEKAADHASKRNLLDDDDDVRDTPIWLTLTTKRHLAGTTRLKPAKIPLPHSLNEDGMTTICAITADPQRVYKDIIASPEFPAALGKRITRVIDFSKLKAKYSRYEAQRKLLSEHDIFVADDRIVNRLPKVLGKTFYTSTQKRPIPVIFETKRTKVNGKLVGHKKRTAAAAAAAAGDGVGSAKSINTASAADMAKEINKAIGCALVSLSPAVNTSVRVAYAHWEPEHVAANVTAVASALVEKWVPHQWRNVKSIYIKGPTTAALPIWQTDQLWLDEADVVADADDDRDFLDGVEKANIGKKRKSLDGQPVEEAAPKTKKAKTSTSRPQRRNKAKAGDDDDGELEKQVAQRKATLRKQKAAAKRDMDG
ncbi:hypothetical protein GQ602_006275 [Ophiocordyceps camponoti-floridani]|uniref:Ribosomal protein L1 n=1 Tax=Ophiocordyceps camponoti-floridani TaxID=2030778 RepID=A0A8H4Q303_9HYPO|nr:hypothetical protein GQ602_006275 [Ophiocordyceps camponoti-floridani]